jgi:hypothetical protein
MQPRRFGKNVKLPATIAIKHQVMRLMLEDALEAERKEKTNANPAQLKTLHPAPVP